MKGAEDGIQIEPFVLDKLNYTAFFPNPEETVALATQLAQLKKHLGIVNFASI